jgi:predicted helicase
MSLQRINQYYTEVADAQRFSGATKETSLRRYFANLIDYYAQQKKLRFVDEVKLKGLTKVPDGALIGRGEYHYGYWEAKDLQDDLEKEIQKKINIGYPTFNILFQDTKQAVLIQDNNREYANVEDPRQLHALLNKFVAYESPEAKAYKEALLNFMKRVPEIAQNLLGTIQNFIENQQKGIDAGTNYNTAFVKQHAEFFEICKTCINPYITKNDINEMIVQHILTEEIFTAVFDDSQFHDENNIAKALTAIEKTFFTGNLKRDTLSLIKDYTHVIKQHATNLQSHDEKQNFLKALYEDFYQAYNPKGADKLGIVYTPSEIVKFMLRTTDYLLEKHFDCTMADKNVHILDPATGTGTFITELINTLPPQCFPYKYQHEIHANELSILPYYIAYLNIEYTYKDKMQTYLTYDNLCWVDTLDILEPLKYGSKQESFVGMVTSENYERIKAQNKRKISVIIGNPPYNANQQNENDNNKNRTYNKVENKRDIGVDGRIKETYIQHSKATKTKQYDMYKRFFRWASDRAEDKSIIAYITNRAFIDSAQDDGFRKCIKDEFNEVHVIDLKGDIRSNDKTQGQNVFDIMAGVAITFLIKNKEREGCKIYYYNIGDSLTKTEKLDILKDTLLKDLTRQTVHPDAKHNWINLSISDFSELIPLIADADANIGEIDEQVGKSKKTIKKEQIFEFSTLGVSTNRDEWVYDFDKDNLTKKVKYFIDIYNTYLKQQTISNADKLWKDYLKKHKDKNGNGKNGNGKPHLVNEPQTWQNSIKWSETLKRNFLRTDFIKNKLLKFDKNNIIEANYRPFIKQYYYAEQELSDRLTRNHYAMFGEVLDKENKIITFSVGKRGTFNVFAVDILTSLDIYLPDAANCLPLYTYLPNGTRQDNITDWALEAFQKQYKDAKQKIGKEDIFHYIYAVLHTPAYREKYALDLKREFPRIPFYTDFWKYAMAGKELMALHLKEPNAQNPQGFQNFAGLGKLVSMPLESLLPKRKNTGIDIFGEKEGEKANRELLKQIKPEVKLKSKPENPEGSIWTVEIDSLTTITSIPALAYEYKLGNRSAIDWVLDQYKPYKSKDESIETQFNNYDFADYKNEVVNLLFHVIQVSIRTMKIVKSL